MLSPHKAKFAIYFLMNMLNKKEIAQIHRIALKRFMESRGLNVLSWSKKAGLTESTLRNFLNGGDSLTSKTLFDLAQAEHVTISDILGEVHEERMVKVYGYVGAGAEVYPVEEDQAGTGAIDEVEAPPGVDPDSVAALIVRGDSMYPVYKENDIIYYARTCDFHDSCLKRECVVKLQDGRAFIKVLSRGSNEKTFNLISYNSPPIEDVKIEWACEILWVKKSRG